MLKTSPPGLDCEIFGNLSLTFVWSSNTDAQESQQQGDAQLWTLRCIFLLQWLHQHFIVNRRERSGKGDIDSVHFYLEQCLSLLNFSTVSGQFGSARRGPLSAIYRERCPQPGPVFRSSSVTSEEILSSSSPSSCSHPQNCFWLLASSPASQPSPGTKEVSMRPTTTTLPVTEEPFPAIKYYFLHRWKNI